MVRKEKEIYPNAKISEIKKKAKKVRYPTGYVFFSESQKKLKKYQKGDFYYIVDGTSVTAMHKPSKKMFKWSAKRKTWITIKYVPGQR